MDKTKALQNLLKGKATRKEIEMLKQALASGEISIGGDVNRSVVIIGSGNKVELTAEALSLLKPGTKTEEPVEGEPPYMGLRYFDTSDADLFYGREALTCELLARVKQEPFLAIVGASGSGKSSVARAGLIPAWKKENERSAIHVITPTAYPLESLAASLTRESESVTATSTLIDDMSRDARSLRLYVKKTLGETKLLLLVDQFEETFTLCKDIGERKAFVENLLSLAIDDSTVRVVIAFRADFYHHCSEYEGLRNAFKSHQEYIGAMTADELQQAITKPAENNGWNFQPGLVDLILSDAGTEPGALPLLSHALLETWKRRQGCTLTLQGYHEAGGVKKAIAQTAESVYDKLTPSEQTIARGIFLRLTQLGEGTQDTRRRVKLDELSPSKEHDAVAKVLKTLVDARLVTTEQDSAEVAHEALIHEWGILRKWLDENRENLRLHRYLTESALEWERSGRNELYLIHRGGRLDDILSLKEHSNFGFNEIEKSYLSACISWRKKERREREQRLRSVAIASVAVALIFLILGAFGMVKSNEATLRADEATTAQANAENNAKIARAGEIAAQSVSLRDKSFDLSLLISIEAFRKAETAQTMGTLLDSIQAKPQLLGYLQTTSITIDINSLAFSPDGKMLASADSNGVFLWDVDTHKIMYQLAEGYAEKVIFSPDGKTLASAGDKSIILWDVETRQPIGQPLAGSTTFLTDLAFSNNGKVLAFSIGKTIGLWDVVAHRPLDTPLIEHNDDITGLAFSPTRNVMAFGDSKNNVFLWDVDTHQRIGAPLVGDTDSVSSVAFSPDGKTLVSGGGHGIVLWDVSTQRPLGFFQSGYASAITGLAFTPDGRILASGNNDDNSITLWDVKKLQPFSQALIGDASLVSNITSLAFSPDGKMLASGSQFGSITLWDITKQNSLGKPVITNAQSVPRLDFSPDGNMLAYSSGNGMINLLSTSTWQSIRNFLLGNTTWNSVAFSPDGKTLASGGDTGLVILWDLTNYRRMGQPLKKHTGIIISVAFSPDGKILASGSADTTIILWDVTSHQPIDPPLTGHNDLVTSVAFSPDGKLLASGSDDNTIILWDLTTHQPIGQPLIGHTSGVTNIDFSPDGKLLASSSWDYSVILWDVKSRQEIGQPLNGHNNRWVFGLAFAPDGKSLASSSDDGSIVLWNLDMQWWIEESCQRAGRNLTPIEWVQYFPEEKYRVTCPQWPSKSGIESTPNP